MKPRNFVITRALHLYFHVLVKLCVGVAFVLRFVFISFFTMHRRTSEQKMRRSSQEVAQVARQPGRMEAGTDFASVVQRAVAAALQAHGIGSPAISPASPPATAAKASVVVTSRDIPEGLAADFLAHNGVCQNACSV